MHVVPGRPGGLLQFSDNVGRKLKADYSAIGDGLLQKDINDWYFFVRLEISRSPEARC